LQTNIYAPFIAGAFPLPIDFGYPAPLTFPNFIWENYPGTVTASFTNTPPPPLHPLFFPLPAFCFFFFYGLALSQHPDVNSAAVERSKPQLLMLNIFIVFVFPSTDSSATWTPPLFPYYCCFPPDLPLFFTSNAPSPPPRGVVCRRPTPSFISLFFFDASGLPYIALPLFLPSLFAGPPLLQCFFFPYTKKYLFGRCDFNPPLNPATFFVPNIQFCFPP